MGRSWVFALALLVIGQSSVGAQSDKQNGPVAPDKAPIVTLALVGGRLIDGYGGVPLENAVILLAGNKIVRIGQVGLTPVPAGVKIIDTNGMSVLPGLWESHGHLIHIGEGDPEQFPDLFASQAKELMAANAKINLMAGITSFRDLGGPLQDQLELRADIESGRSPGPRLFLAGPYLRQGKSQKPPFCRGASCLGPTVETQKEAELLVNQLVSAGADQIKVYGVWDPALLEAVTNAAHARNVGVDADLRTVSAVITAIKAGVDRLHHVFTADALSDYSDEEIRLLVRGWKPRSTGPMANIMRGPTIIPTVQMREAYVRVLNFPELLDHPALGRDYSPEIYEHLRESWKNPSAVPWGIGAQNRLPTVKRKLQHFIEAGGREQIVAGTDAGAPFNMHSPLAREIRDLAEAGLTPMEAIQSATLRAAQMQGVDDRLGTISEGKLADIIVVDGNVLADLSLLEHRIVLVIKNGELFRPQKNFVD